MKILFPVVAMFTVVSTLNAQAGPAPVVVRAQTILEFPAGVDPAENFVGAPGAKLIYYLTDTEIRVYDRTSKATRVVGKGKYDGITTSAAGDWLALERAADESKNAQDAPDYVWTLPVDPRTGTATGEPRRASLIPGGAPAFSPDGKWIAFVTNDSVRRLAVIPASGGPERVVYTSTARRLNWPVADPLWSADGKWIYFAQRASEKNGERSWVKWRVPSAGGAAVAVTDAGHDVMLSPNAEYVIRTVQDTTDGITFEIADPATKKVVGRTKTFNQKAGGACYFAWSGKGLNMLAAMYNEADTMHARTILSGADRVLPAAIGPTWSLSMSPSGKELAAVVNDDARNGLAVAIMSPDGTGRRILQTGGPGSRELLWSPDGKSLAFFGDSLHVYIADVATGKVTRVGSGDIGGWVSMRWRPDSRTLLYLRHEGTPTKMSVSIHEASVGGPDRLVRDITPELPPDGENWYGTTWFLGDSSVLVIRLGLAIPIYGGAPHKLYDPVKIPAADPNLRSIPAVSDDGRWVAMPASDGKSFQVYGIDGQPHPAVTVPGSGKIAYETFFHPDNRTLIVTATQTANTPTGVYLLPIDGGSPRTLVAPALGSGNGIVVLAIPRDGKTVIYRASSASIVSLVEADLGAGLYSNTPVKH